jgi:hypothetical protein
LQYVSQIRDNIIFHLKATYKVPNNAEILCPSHHVIQYHLSDFLPTWIACLNLPNSAYAMPNIAAPAAIPKLSPMRASILPTAALVLAKTAAVVVPVVEPETGFAVVRRVVVVELEMAATLVAITSPDFAVAVAVTIPVGAVGLCGSAVAVWM